MHKAAVWTAMVLAAASTAWAGQVTVDFEDVSLDSSGYYNGADGAGEFTADGATFLNNYSESTFGGVTYVFWDGFALSNHTDTTTPGFGNQYSTFAGAAYSGEQFAVAYDSAVVNLPDQAQGAVGGWFCNTTYAALAMRDGYFNADKFGGDDGDDPDWFMLTVTGTDGPDGTGNRTGTVTRYLGDYSRPDGTDLLIDDWTWLNLQPLGTDVRSLKFTFASSDVTVIEGSGTFLDTPAYFALDNLVYNVPEPASLAVMAIGAVGLLRSRRR